MKNRILFMILGCVLISLSACKHIEPDYYDQPIALNFRDFSAYDLDHIVTTYHSSLKFTDSDYVSHNRIKKDSICLSIVGEPVDEDRTFCLKTESVSDSASVPMQIMLSNDGVYTMKAGEREMWVSYNVVAPQDYGKTHVLYLVIDTENPLHQFAKGRLEALKMQLYIIYDLTSDKWNSSLLGEFSNGKYKFIMDFLGDTLDNYTLSYADKTRIKTAYDNYLNAGNPEILDDKGEPISWPI